MGTSYSNRSSRKGWENVGWICLASNKYQRRALGKRVMNPAVRKRYGEFLQ
jgi:hypothetical protein